MSDQTLILLLSGPNLNLLGDREPAIYGHATLAEHVEAAGKAAAALGHEVEHVQSNHEGDLIEAVQQARGRAAAIVVNAGALTHTSWALHDALAAFDGVVIELHLSNPAAREPFRHTSVVAPVADGSIAGFGALGYPLAIEAVHRLLTARAGGLGVTAGSLFAETLPPLDVSGRLERLRETFPDAGVDGLLVTAAANIRWLTGFSGSAGLLLVTPNRAVLTSDGRYRTQSEEQLAEAGVAQAVDIVIGGTQAQRDALVAAWGTTPNLGLEADNVTWSGQRTWDEALGSGVALVPTRGCVEVLRQVKDAGEVARMERAAAIADDALASAVPLLARAEAESVTEAFVAAALDHAMRVRGAEDSAFETIVASGPNSAKPHARPSDRQIRAGDPVVIDFGAIYEGYRSDMTRTFCVGGEPAGELARVFSVVAESQRVGVAAVGPGVVTGDVDQACREVIAEAGWAERFEHGTGHGVGLDIHEAPSVGPGATAILAPGVVATVEPGVYLAGVGGVRIEDTLVVVEDGRRPLTMFPKDVSL